MGQKIKCEKKCHSIQKRQYNSHCWYCCCHVFLRMRCPKAFHWDLITHKKITRCRLTLKEETTLTRRALRNSYMDGWVIHSLAMSIWVNCNKHYHRHQGLNIIKRLWMFVEKYNRLFYLFVVFFEAMALALALAVVATSICIYALCFYRVSAYLRDACTSRYTFLVRYTNFTEAHRNSMLCALLEIVVMHVLQRRKIKMMMATVDNGENPYCFCFKP